MIGRWFRRRAARRQAEADLIEFFATCAAIARVERRIHAGEAPPEPGRLIAVTDCRVLASDRHATATRQRAELETYDTADVAAETVGDLTYEEQSEMIGDPIAEVLMRETGDDQ